MGAQMAQSDPRRVAAPAALYSTGVVPPNAVDQNALSRDRLLVRVPVTADANAARLPSVYSGCICDLVRGLVSAPSSR
jgi:hypothetical protein